MIERKALSISLTPEMHAFVAGLVKEGGYSNSSEVVRAGLRLLQHEEARQRGAVPRSTQPSAQQNRA